MRFRLGAFVALFLLAAPAAAQPTFTALTAGKRFTCGLSPEGRAYCWGSDVEGQLGIGKPVDRCDESIYAKGPCARAPVAVAGDHKFTAISAGDNHVCAIDDEGAVYCWGEGRLSVREQCVVEASRSDEPGIPFPCNRRPTLVAFDTPVVSIAAGEYTTCAVDESGRAWCWGDNDRTATPALIELDEPLETIAVGGEDVCGLTVSKAIRCWSGPELVAGDITAPSDLTGWTAVTVGAKHGCALDAGGIAHCWGSDADAALGVGPSRHQKYDEVPVTPVLGNHVFRSLVTGTKRTCGIDQEDALYCWGRVPERAGDDQCLDSNGVANTNDCTVHPVLIDDNRFSSVAIGASHQCGLSFAGVAVCWGANESGQLGDGTLVSSNKLRDVRTQGVTPGESRRLDLQARASEWLSLKGLGALIAIIAFGAIAVRGVGLFSRWWTAGVNTPISSRTSGVAGTAALGGVLIGWGFFAFTWLGIGQANGGTGDVAYGLAMMALLGGGGLAMALSGIAAIVAVIVLRRDRGAKAALLALVLGSLTIAAGTAVSLMLFWPRER